MRVVLDTGILIAALITKDTPPALIYQAWRKKRFELITSGWQLDEFRRVSRYSKLRRFLKPAEAGNLINGLLHQATVTRIITNRGIIARPGRQPRIGYGGSESSAVSRDGMLHMMFKLGQCAEKKWRKLRGFEYLAKVVTGIKFKDGIEVTEVDQVAA